MSSRHRSSNVNRMNSLSNHKCKLGNLCWADIQQMFRFLCRVYWIHQERSFKAQYLQLCQRVNMELATKEQFETF